MNRTYASDSPGNGSCGEFCECGACEGIQSRTPLSTSNRPGLNKLAYRVGTHSDFFETMKARLASMSVTDTPIDDESQAQVSFPLQGLTTRESNDASIAMLDAWATLGDVLTFYQERIANECYLRTATQRRSILELARLVGYKLRPGVAATVYLAYTLEDRQTEQVEIPPGSRAQSIPGPQQLPQYFETSETLMASSLWNNLSVRTRRPQNITLANALAVNNIYINGIDSNLKAGELILMKFDGAEERFVVRTVLEAQADFDSNITDIQLQASDSELLLALPLLVQFIEDTKFLSKNSAETRLVNKAAEIITESYLGTAISPKAWSKTLSSAADGALPNLNTLFTQFVANLTELLDQAGNNAIGVTAPAKFVDSLLLEPLAQAKGSLSLSRSLQQAVASGTDLHPQLLVNFAPRIKGTFYRAWSGARVNAAESPLRAVYAMRVNAPLFGAGAAKIPTYAGTGVSISGTSSVSPGQLLPPSQWDEWPLDNDELTATDSLFLDQLYEKVQPESYVLIQQPAFQGMERQVLQITNLQNLQRTAYGISGKTTRLTLEANWRSENDATLAALRRALIYAQSEQLELADKPIDDDVYGQSIELSGLFENLKSGRWIILSGERADIEQVSGVPVSELLMVSSLEHGYDAALAGDSMHTSLNLATPTAYRYKRDTLKIYANVVKATHGETREEVLGSGDGAQSMQTFELKQPPLTFVAATTPQGVESTLNVYINNVNWPEADSLADLGARERGYITQTDNDDKVSVRFGDGVNGERLPTGVENVRAVYRNGIGANGNVEAEQISLLMSRPSGVKEVINPLRASGGAGRESRDLARENAPLAVKALDRLLSVQDYADFSRTFAGIGKATARKLSNGRQQLVHVTIAGVDDIPIDPVSDLYSNLVAALKRFGDPDLMVNVQLRELLILMLSAKVQLQENYLWEPVVSDIKSALLQTFGFQQRALGQAVGLDEVISVIQAVRGVAYVDVDAFGGLPEKKLDQGTRRLLTLDELAERAQQIADPGRFRDDIEKPTMGGDKGMQKNSGKLIVDPANLVRANLADFEGGVLRPAQLAIFSAAVQDTLILNQIT